MPGKSTDIFKVLEKVGNGLAFAVGEGGLVEAIAGSPWREMKSVSAAMYG